MATEFLESSILSFAAPIKFFCAYLWYRISENLRETTKIAECLLHFINSYTAFFCNIACDIFYCGNLILI